ncbi:hypothetical protein C8Q79DRAFT_871043, partial [Trametes meyenii]
PFYFDSGASIHLSPVREDFYELNPIAPHAIRGVNGSAIHAVAIGRIKLSVGGNQQLSLDNVLFVPQASVRLISVRVL